MTFSLFPRRDRQNRPVPKGVPRDLSPHLMRDIGFDPWPDRRRLPHYPLW